MVVDSIRIHTADWIVPINRPPIRRGGVAVDRGAIIATGEIPRLQQQFPTARILKHLRAVLMPALINAHIHLELSHLATLAADSPDTSFTGWITRLIDLRNQLGAQGEEAEQAALRTCLQQDRTGVGVMADIGNTGIGRQLAAVFPGQLFPFREYLGLHAQTLDKNLFRLEREPESHLCSGHAPYSTHPRLLRRLKERAVALDQVFPIHTAEPAAEGEMIRQGRGEMADFIRRRGLWDNSFVPTGRGGSIHYLRDLDLLDSRTLCIHAIHVADEEIRLMAGEGVKVCLCPGSNQFLGTGRAPVRRYLDHGILPALGTDSLASNPELSLWREMRLLAEHHPEVEPAEIVTMATLGGAAALGVDHRYGSLETGKKADFLAVPIVDGLVVDSDEQVYRFLVTRVGADPERIRD